MLKRKGLITLSVLIVMSSAVGGVSGWFLGGMFKPSAVMNNEVYTDGEIVFSSNIESVSTLFKSANVKNLSELSNVDITSLIGMNGLTIGDIAEASQLSLYSHDYVKITSNNYALSTMIITNEQTTNSTWIKKGSLYFKENISYSSNASFGERTYNFDGKSTQTVLTKANENSLEYYRITGLKKASDGNFSNSSKSSYYINTPSDKLDDNGNLVKSYSTTFGLSLFNAFNYDYNESNLLKKSNGEYESTKITNSKTGEETEYVTSITSTEEGYEINLVIDVDKAVGNYASYIYTTTRDASNIAKMKEKPVFKSAGVKISTDKSLKITSVHVDELYNVISNIAGAVPTSCTSDFLITYDDENVKIPTTSEVITYEES